MGGDVADITIVSGFPRSGTSLMMQILEAGGLETLCDGLRGADPDNPRGYYEYGPVKAARRDLSWLDRAKGRAVKVVDPLLRELPADRRYRVLWMDRDLSEVARSQRRMLEHLGAPDGGPRDPDWVEIFRAQLGQARDWLAARPQFSVLTVSYNALVADPEPDVARVDDFLGGGFDRAAMERVVDRTLYRVRSGG